MTRVDLEADRSRARSHPDVRPGNLIQYRPLIPLPCQAHALKGNRTSSIRFTMTDNNDESVVLNEAYTARILISW